MGSKGSEERATRERRRRREKAYREEQRSGWGRDDFSTDTRRAPAEFENFRRLTQGLLQVPKSELDDKLKGND